MIVVVDLCGIFDLLVLEICLTICKMCWDALKICISHLKFSTRKVVNPRLAEVIYIGAMYRRNVK